jgi:hypothetical protein
MRGLMVVLAAALLAGCADPGSGDVTAADLVMDGPASGDDAAADAPDGPDASSCQPEGGSCTLPSECCNGQCAAGVCGASGGTAPLDTCGLLVTTPACADLIGGPCCAPAMQCSQTPQCLQLLFCAAGCGTAAGGCRSVYQACGQQYPEGFDAAMALFECLGNSGDCSGDAISCQATGASCTTTGSCCAGQCQNGLCGCTPNGLACSSSDECCSATCRNGGCVRGS